MGVFDGFMPKQKGFSPYDFIPNERLKLIVIDFDHYYKYKEEIKADQLKAEQEAMAFGEQVTKLAGDSRRAGLALKCVVLARSNEADAPAMQAICSPKTAQKDIIELTIQIPNPEFVFMNNRWSYGWGVNTEKVKNGYPAFDRIFPDISEAGVKVTAPDGSKAKLSWSQMSEAQKAMYHATGVEENSRRAQWKALIDWWFTQSQEDARKFMKQLIAQYAGIVNKNEMGDWTTVSPEIGTIWEVGISGSEYPEPKPYRFGEKQWNIGAYVEKDEGKAKILKEILATEPEEDQPAW